MSLLASLLNTRKSVNLMASYSSERKAAKKTQRKCVRFPSAVLMQQAIADGDLAEMRRLISLHGSEIVSEREPCGLPPVMRAVFESKNECLKFLVEAGADLSAKDEEQWTALHVAAAMDDMEAAELIVGACNASFLTQVRNLDGERPIDMAESMEMARFLLQADLMKLSSRAKQI